MTSVLSSVRSSLVLLGAFTIVCGGIYPAIVTGLLQAGAPHAAQGSLVYDDKGAVIGSSLIGQNFDDAKYVWGRLSATTPNPYDASASTGSNLGVNNPALLDAVKGRLKALQEADPDNKAAVPVDLVTASASGLDPEISPAAAAYQVRRIAKARGISEDQVQRALALATSGRTFGLLGEPRVHVLKANLILDGRNP
jgi:K+-transporting ATPase ATPase C chain